jgi:tetratricopeptide (TPR) repeat protein
MDADTEIQLQQIEAMAKREDYGRALEKLAKLIAENPNVPRIWACQAYVHSREGKREESVRDWSRAISLFHNASEEPHYFYMRGIEFFLMRSFPEAISDFTSVIRLCDKYHNDYYRAPGYFFRADAYVRIGEFAKAKADCEQLAANTQIWTDRMRTKADILADCDKEQDSH